MEDELTKIELAMERLLDNAFNFSLKIISALIVLVIGILIIRVLRYFIKRVTEKRDVDPTVSGFLLNMVSWLLKLLLFIAVVSKLGIETSSFVAVLGAMGLAIGLSLQGSLSNFTGGLLIIMFKPFRVGDYITAQNISGTVKSIQIFSTQVNTDNNQAVFIPNGILSNGTIVNFSRETHRRANIQISVSTTNDLEKVTQLFMDILKNNDKVLKDPAPAVVLSDLSRDAAVFYIRPWALRTNFWEMNGEVLLEIKNTLEKENIKIPTQSIEVFNK